MTAGRSHGLTFNLVFVGDSFLDFHLFASTLLDHCDESLRLVANGCTPEAMEAMRRWADERSDRVVEVLDVSPLTISHGAALDRTLGLRDDGDHFAFLDTDIKARGPFVPELLAVLDAGHDVVSAGRSVFVGPEGDPVGTWLVGDMLRDEHGFEFGCAHAAIYRRAPLLATMARWEVGFGSSAVDSGVEGGDLTERAAGRLRAMGHDHTTYDSVKVVNILLQGDGHRLRHVDVANLLHIGGLSTDRAEPVHYPVYAERLRDELRRNGDPDGRFARAFPEADRRRRAQVHLGAVLRAVAAGAPVPDLPPEVTGDDRRFLAWLVDEIVAMG